MRIAYTPVPFGAGEVARPFVTLRFGAAPREHIDVALLDTGSVRTVASRQELLHSGIDLGPELERVDLRFGGIAEYDVPVHLLDAAVVSPDSERWPDVELPGIPVACCETEDLPTLILGSSALMRLLVLLRETTRSSTSRAGSSSPRPPTLPTRGSSCGESLTSYVLGHSSYSVVRSPHEPRTHTGIPHAGRTALPAPTGARALCRPA